MRLSIKLSAILFALIGTGCQTLTSSSYKSEVQVHKLPEAQTYEARFKITEGGGAHTIISSAKIVFKAGEPAKMTIQKNGMNIYASVYISAQGDDPLCLCKTRIRKDGKYIYHYSEIVTPISPGQTQG